MEKGFAYLHEAVENDPADPLAGDIVRARLLLQRVRRGRFRRLAFEREMHALMPAILLQMALRDAFDFNTQAQPPDGQLAEAM